MKKLFQLIVVVILFFLPFVDRGCSRASATRAVNESARDIPAAYNVDVLFVGGTSGGLAAAVEAAQNGATVFLAAERPYLGVDICGTYRLCLEPGEEPISPLAGHPNVQFNFYRPAIGKCEAEMH